MCQQHTSLTNLPRFNISFTMLKEPHTTLTTRAGHVFKLRTFFSNALGICAVLHNKLYGMEKKKVLLTQMSLIHIRPPPD